MEVAPRRQRRRFQQQLQRRRCQRQRRQGLAMLCAAFKATKQTARLGSTGLRRTDSKEDRTRVPRPTASCWRAAPPAWGAPSRRRSARTGEQRLQKWAHRAKSRRPPPGGRAPRSRPRRRRHPRTRPPSTARQGTRSGAQSGPPPRRPGAASTRAGAARRLATRTACLKVTKRRASFAFSGLPSTASSEKQTRVQPPTRSF
mmetsp:Transcript_68687/g.193793  ORF Transcript_68687/g.193793 Transcript_68687/m.193793 type:complete len:201 (-) Transcript_68687:745-1347(-)